LRLLFAKIHVSECYGDISTVENLVRETSPIRAIISFLGIAEPMAIWQHRLILLPEDVVLRQYTHWTPFCPSWNERRNTSLDSQQNKARRANVYGRGRYVRPSRSSPEVLLANVLVSRAA